MFTSVISRHPSLVQAASYVAIAVYVAKLFLKIKFTSRVSRHPSQ